MVFNHGFSRIATDVFAVEIGRIGRFLYKLRGATKSFANATLRASRVSPMLLKCEVSLESPFGAEGAAVFNTEAQSHRGTKGAVEGD